MHSELNMFCYYYYYYTAAPGTFMKTSTQKKTYKLDSKHHKWAITTWFHNLENINHELACA